MPVQGDFAGGDRLPQQPLLAPELLRRILRLPLERGEGLGYKAGDADRHADPLPLGLVRVAVIAVDDLLPEPRDAHDILIRLGGRRVIKKQLHRRPAGAESLLDRAEDFLLRQVFVDGIPQPLRPRLGREGQAAAPQHIQASGEIP